MMTTDREQGDFVLCCVLINYEKLMFAVPLLVHCHSSAENLERKMKRVLQILHFVQDDSDRSG